MTRIRGSIMSQIKFDVGYVLLTFVLTLPKIIAPPITDVDNRQAASLAICSSLDIE